MPRPARHMPQPRAVLVAPQPEAVEAGAAILRAGGNALDALIASALTQGVVDPMMCGLGGLGVLHLHDPRTGQQVIFDGLSTAPAACTEDMWAKAFLRECNDGFGYVVEGYANERGHLAVTTPGILRTLAMAHTEFGRLPWADLFAPAIGFAEEGWIIRPHVSTVFTMNEAAYGRLSYAEKLGFSEEGRALYLRPDGTPKRLGEAVRNPALAQTLRTIAHDGAEDFYTGALAARIVADMQAHGGLLSAEDLAGFQPRRLSPLRTTYRGREVAVPPPPSGGVVVAEMLRILERFDLVAMGHNSPEYIRVVAEAMKIAGRDREEHIGDPAFVTPPLDLLLSDAYADAMAARIRRGEKTPLTRALGDAKNTTTVSAVDDEGMVVSITHTLATPSGVIPPGTGFMLNGAMNWYDPRPGRAGSIAPGKKRFSAMAPSIVFEEGKPVMTVSSPGGAWIGTSILQVLLNVLDWGMTMQEAVMAPRFAATTDEIDLSNRIPRAVEKALQEMGYGTRRNYHSYPFAAPHGVTLWDGELEGGADPQRDGYVAVIA